MSQSERAEAGGWSVVPPRGADGSGPPAGPRLPDASEVPGAQGMPAVPRIPEVPGVPAVPQAPAADVGGREPERPPSWAERRVRARSMVGPLAGALAGQVEEIGRTADDEAPEGWWFTPSQRG